MIKRHANVILILGVVLMLAAGWGAVQWRARCRFHTRGWTSDFPGPIADTPPATACVNAALTQYEPADLAWALDAIEDYGFDWVRQRFAWAEIEPAPGEFDWAAGDRVMAEAEARDLRLLAVLDGAPDWAGMPPDPAAFARFAGAFAARYGETITYYQIWHNPNLGSAWGGRADAFGYAELLADAATAIRAVDDDARIVLGSLAPTSEVGANNFAEDVFFEMLMVAGVGPHFDVAAVQPYGFETGPLDRRVSRDVLNFSRAILMREALVEHGMEGTAVWASDFGWTVGPDSIWGEVSVEMQAAYTVEALARAEREWPWMGVMCVNGFQPRPVDAGVERETPDAEEHWGFALFGPESEPRPAAEAVRAWATQRSKQGVATPGFYPANTELADFEGTWTLGPQGADIGQSGDRVSLDFEGTGVALTVRRGPYRAFLFVTVDGEPAPALPRDREGRAYVVLYDPLAARATVPLAEDLPYGAHTVEATAERGWQQWALADWRVANPPDPTGYRIGLMVWAAMGALGLTLASVAGRRVAWGALGGAIAAAWGRLRGWLRALISVLVSAIYIFATWQVLYGEPVFRRLGQGEGAAALLLAAALFYFSPWMLLSLAAGALVAVIVWIEPAMGLALTILTAPLYMHPLSLLGKSFALAELVLLPTLVGWATRLVRRWRRGDGLIYPPKRDALPYLRPILAFVLLALVTTGFAAHRRVALRELRLVVIEPLLWYLALVTLPMSKRERWHIIDAFVLSGVMVGVVGLVQYFLLGDVITAEGGIRRLHSVYGSPNNVGLYLGRVLPVTLALALWGGASPLGAWKSFWRDRRRVAYTLALLPIGLALLLSFSKGAIVVGVPAALFVMGMLAGPRWRRITLVALALGLIALIPLLRTPRFAGLLDLTGGTTGFRIALWHSSWALLRDHPWVGVGLDNFLYAYRTRYVLPTAWEEFNLSHPHNLLFDYAVRLGLGGLLVAGWFQVAFWRRMWPLRRRDTADLRRRALALGMMGAMANFLAHGLVDASYFVIDLAYAFALALAVSVWLRHSSL